LWRETPWPGCRVASSRGTFNPLFISVPLARCTRRISGVGSGWKWSCPRIRSCSRWPFREPCTVMLSRRAWRVKIGTAPVPLGEGLCVSNATQRNPSAPAPRVCVQNLHGAMQRTRGPATPQPVCVCKTCIAQCNESPQGTGQSCCLTAARTSPPTPPAPAPKAPSPA
jgi:hypothetical protein